MKIYQPEIDNPEFWNRIDQLPVDTSESLQLFWDLVHAPGSDYDSGMLEYQARLDRYICAQMDSIINSGI